MALAVALALVAATALYLALGLRIPSGDGDGGRSSERLLRGWASFDPLFPLAPGLKELSALRTGAAEGASGALGASSSGRVALRLRALSQGGPRTFAVSGAPTSTGAGSGRPASPSAGAGPAVLGRIVAARRALRPLVSLGDLTDVIERELDDLPDLRSVGDLGQIPGLDGIGQAVDRAVTDSLGSLNVTVGNLRSDSRFDVLLVSSGRRVLERYVYRDSEIGALAGQVNRQSGLLTAEAIEDGGALEHVAASPLDSAEADATGTSRRGLSNADTREAAAAGGRTGGARDERGAREGTRESTGAPSSPNFARSSSGRSSEGSASRRSARGGSGASSGQAGGGSLGAGGSSSGSGASSGQAGGGSLGAGGPSSGSGRGAGPRAGGN